MIKNVCGLVQFGDTSWNKKATSDSTDHAEINRLSHVDEKWLHWTALSFSMDGNVNLGHAEVNVRLSIKMLH